MIQDVVPAWLEDTVTFTALLLSVLFIIPQIIGKWHGILSKTHRLETIKLELEIIKLQKELNVEHIDNNPLNLQKQSSQTTKNSLFRIKYSTIWLAKYFIIYILGVLMAVITAIGFIGISADDSIGIKLLLSSLVIDGILYAGYIFTDEWLKTNRQ